MGLKPRRTRVYRTTIVAGAQSDLSIECCPAVLNEPDVQGLIKKSTGNTNKTEPMSVWALPGGGVKNLRDFCQKNKLLACPYGLACPPFSGRAPRKFRSTATRVIVGLGRSELPKGLPEKRAAFPVVSSVKNPGSKGAGGL